MAYTPHNCNSYPAFPTCYPSPVTFFYGQAGHLLIPYRDDYQEITI